MGKMAASLNNNSDDGREKGWTRLAYAANAGDMGRVLQLLAGADRSGIDIDARDYSGCTSLTLATQKGHTAVVETLLAYGANPNLQDLDHIPPFWQAARYGHVSILRLLLQTGRLSNVNQRPASLHQHFPETPLSIAIKEGHQEMVELLARADGIKPYLTVPHRKDSDGKTSMLGLTIRNGLEEAALALLNKCDFKDAESGDGNHSDSTTENTIEPISKLLVLAISAGCSRIVRELLTKHDIDINAAHVYYAGKELDWFNHTPLMVASSRGDLNTVRSLLDMDKIRPGANSGRGTALTAAAEGGFVDVAKILIADGRIQIDCKNMYERTALSHAAESAFETIVAELLPPTQIAKTAMDEHRLYGP